MTGFQGCKLAEVAEIFKKLLSYDFENIKGYLLFLFEYES